MTSQLAICNFEGAHWLIFGPNVPPLIYYSHIPNIIISVLLAFYILFKNRKVLVNKILFYTIIAFELWVLFALIFWATNRGDMIMFAWLMDILVEPLVYIGCLYLLYVIFDKKDISFNKKLVLGVLYLPIALLLPTKLMLSGFDVGTCLANEGPVALYYTYFVEIVVTLWTVILCTRRFIASKEQNARKEILYLSIGTILLLLAFAWGNITGSFTDDWALGDYGLFGMPIFIGFLVYSIVRFRLFNIKIIGTTALVLTLWVATASLLSIQDIDTTHGVVAITLILTTIFGWSLINSVRKEVKQREKIEKLAEDLQVANEGQSNLIHIMNHQIKGYLSKSRNIFSELLADKEYGPINDEAKNMMTEGFNSLTEGVGFVQQVLNGSSAESGTLTYLMNPVNLKDLVTDVVAHQSGHIESKKLTYSFDVDEGDYNTIGDNVQLRECFRNLIENSVNYTPEGGIKMRLSRKENSILFTITDTGVGVSQEDMPKIFLKGGRGKDSLKININSTGYGLAFVKAVVEAHKGKVWCESEGTGHGSTFYMELPSVK